MGILFLTLLGALGALRFSAFSFRAASRPSRFNPFPRFAPLPCPLPSRGEARKSGYGSMTEFPDRGAWLEPCAEFWGELKGAGRTEGGGELKGAEN
jgi:hypothetical protein